MKRTTVFLPDDLKRALERTARRRRCSEADLIREGVRQVTRDDDLPEPVLPLFASGDPKLSADVETALEGFGED